MQTSKLGKKKKITKEEESAIPCRFLSTNKILARQNKYPFSMHCFARDCHSDSFF